MLDDAQYVARRAEVTRMASAWPGSGPTPEIAYTEAEHELYRAVCRQLYLKHAHLACAPYLEAWEAVGLPTTRIPQLEEVSARLTELTGFRFVPRHGETSRHDFLRALGDGIFHGTLHVRHHTQPPFTSEPDLVHSLIGHAILLGSPRFARLYRLSGEAAKRLETQEGLDFLARVFWFTCEYGVLMEHGQLVCWGACLLSSYGEIDQFRHADVRPLHFPDLGAERLNRSGYQPVLYRADSIERLEDELSALLETMDDDTPHRLALA